MRAWYGAGLEGDGGSSGSCEPKRANPATSRHFLVAGAGRCDLALEYKKASGSPAFCGNSRKSQVTLWIFHVTSRHISSSEETFRRTGGARSSQPSRALQYISARDGRPGRRPLRSSRGSPGDRPFPHRARQNATDTGVELDVSGGFFPARGFAADFRLRGGSRATISPTTSFVSWTMIVCNPWRRSGRWSS